MLSRDVELLRGAPECCSRANNSTERGGDPRVQYALGCSAYWAAKLVSIWCSFGLCFSDCGQPHEAMLLQGWALASSMHTTHADAMSEGVQQKVR